MGCIPEFEPFNRRTHSVARSRLTSSLRRSIASLQRSPWRYIIRNSRWSRTPCLPALAASRKVLISVGSRKSLGRCGSVTQLLTLSGLATSNVSAVSFVICCLDGGDPPPLKWSDLRYVFDIKEDCNGKEAIPA